MGKCRAAATLVLALGLGISGSRTAFGQQDWPAYGGHDGTHYSSLSQINRDNVKNLAVAWKYDTGEKGGIESHYAAARRGGEENFAHDDGIGFDAATGKL